MVLLVVLGVCGVMYGVYGAGAVILEPPQPHSECQGR